MYMPSQFYLNTKYYFGVGVVKESLASEIQHIKAKKLLLLYGGGSIKKNGIYDTVINAIKASKVDYIELDGVQPNPIDTHTMEAVNICRKERVDLILAVGGGSVIDEAKVVANIATNHNYRDVWSYMNDEAANAKNDPLPVFAVIIIAATASENNYGAVITNTKTKDKWGVKTKERPLVCFSDPSYTLTVSKWQTGCGCFDIMSHLLEQYYDVDQTFVWTKNYVIANMKTLLQFTPIVMKDLNNLEARSNILWASAWSHNGLSSFNTRGGDWKVHGLAHSLSGKWDASHGAALALVTPTYIEYMCSISPKFKELSLELAKELFNVNSIDEYIKCFKDYINLCGLPKTYKELNNGKNVTDEEIEWFIGAFDRNTEGWHELGVAIYNKIPK